MKLKVTWKNNEPSANQRVYHITPETKAKRNLAEVAPGLESIEIDLAALGGDPLTWPGIITVVAYNGDTESAPMTSTHYITDSDLPGPAVMKDALTHLKAVIGQEPPIAVIKTTTPMTENFGGGSCHVLFAGVLLTSTDTGVLAFDPVTLAPVAVPAELNAVLPSVQNIPFVTPDGRLLFLGDGYFDNDKVWEWKDGALTKIAEAAVRNEANYRYAYMGNNGKVYRFGGIDTIVDKKLMYSVFDPATNTVESFKDATDWQGNGTDLKGSIDYNGIIVLADTTYHSALIIDTNTGIVTVEDQDESIFLASASYRTQIGHHDLVLFANSAKRVMAVSYDQNKPDAGIFKELVSLGNVGQATCSALVNSGEVVFGTDDGKLVFIDVVDGVAMTRVEALPDGKYVSNIIRHDGGFTVATIEHAYHFSYEGAQHTFDAGFYQSQLGNTNMHRGW